MFSFHSFIFCTITCYCLQCIVCVFTFSFVQMCASLLLFLDGPSCSISNTFCIMPSHQGSMPSQWCSMLSRWCSGSMPWTASPKWTRFSHLAVHLTLRLWTLHPPIADIMTKVSTIGLIAVHSVFCLYYCRACWFQGGRCLKVKQMPNWIISSQRRREMWCNALPSTPFYKLWTIIDIIISIFIFPVC